MNWRNEVERRQKDSGYKIEKEKEKENSSWRNEVERRRKDNSGKS